MSERAALRRHRDAKSLLTVGAAFLGVTLFMFMHVWLPTQAERSLIQLKRMQEDVFRQKSELTILKERYSEKTSLTVLDQWAKQHGPWVPAGAANVVTFE